MNSRTRRGAVGLTTVAVLAIGIGGWAARLPTSVPSATDANLAITLRTTNVIAPRVAHATRAKTTVLVPGTIEGHRFVKSFTLANGALRLDPFGGTTPALSSTEETTMWATQDIGGAIEGIGFADVTLNRSKTKQIPGPTVTAYSNTPALVGLVKNDSVANCGYIGAFGHSRFIPISQGWFAVIFPLNLHKSDAVFSAARNECERLTPNTVTAAYETLSVVWHLESHRTTGTVIVASVPKCGEITMSGGGGNEYKGLFEYQVEAAVLDRPLGTTCSPATNFDEGPNYASPSTTHGFTGPVLNAGPFAGDVMTPQGPKSQPLY